MSPRDAKRSDQAASLELEATPEMCHYCFDLLVNELNPHSKGGWRLGNISGGSDASEPPFASTIPSSAKAPLFVTWDKRRSSSDERFDLRGCIGTLSPKPLLTAVGEYALTSAFRDRRFDPIKTHEVPQLRVAVSLLVKYEECSHCHDWVVGVHGIIIKFIERDVDYSATYLPEVAREQGWTQQEAVASLVRKSGYTGPLREEVLNKISCTRYQSSKTRLTYQEYVDTVGKDPLKQEKKRHRFLFF